MTNRYCVEVIHEVVNPFYSHLDHDFEPHFFDNYDAAETYRKQCVRSGIRVSDVMDLTELPF